MLHIVYGIGADRHLEIRVVIEAAGEQVHKVVVCVPPVVDDIAAVFIRRHGPDGLLLSHGRVGNALAHPSGVVREGGSALPALALHGRQHRLVDGGAEIILGGGDVHHAVSHGSLVPHAEGQAGHLLPELLVHGVQLRGGFALGHGEDGQQGVLFLQVGPRLLELPVLQVRKEMDSGLLR